MQYVAQKAIGEDNTATFKFRPRKSVGQGYFIAKSGATGAEKAATFNYMVKEEDKTMTLTGKNNIIKANEIADATFVVTPTSFTGEDILDLVFILMTVRRHWQQINIKSRRLKMN